jgi:hypothetical protein
LFNSVRSSPQRRTFVSIDDFTEYKRCRVQLHAQGIVLRDTVLGAEVKTKKQQVCQAGDFLVAEIDAKVGGFGMTLGDDGKYRPRFRVRKDHGYRIYAPIRNLDFLRMATDAWEEMRLRGLNTRVPLKLKLVQMAKRLPDESWCQRPDWISASRLSLDKYEQPRMLFKFSKAEWNKELIQAGRVHISPASHYNDSAAVSPEESTEVQFCKHFRFSYQTEFRFVLIPHVHRQLESFFLHLGNISDIAEMVSMGEFPSIRWQQRFF